MSYRLKSLTTGNFLLIFEPEGTDKMTETLCCVASIISVDEEAEELIYELVGIRATSQTYYPPTWTSRRVSTKQDLKFTVLTRFEADRWLEAKDVTSKWAKAAIEAKEALTKAELAVEGLNRYFLGAAPAVLEGQSRPAPPPPELMRSGLGLDDI